MGGGSGTVGVVVGGGVMVGLGRRLRGLFESKRKRNWMALEREHMYIIKNIHMIFLVLLISSMDKLNVFFFIG